MKFFLLSFILIFGFKAFPIDIDDLDLELHFIENSFDEDEIAEAKLEEKDSIDLSDVVDQVKKEKESIERNLAEEQEFTNDNNNEDEELDEEPSKNNLKKRVDFGDVELRISHRKKEPYIEEIFPDMENSLAVKNRNLAFKKKRNSNLKKPKKK